MEILLPVDFKEFLSLLNAHQVDYLVVGGYAVNQHGYSRNTNDLDVWIGPGIDNARRCLDVLREFGFGDCGLKAENFANPRNIFRMGVPPLRLELLMSVSGLDFADAYARKEVHAWSGVTVNVVGLDDLRTNKRASGRHKDLADLDRLPK